MKEYEKLALSIIKPLTPEMQERLEQIGEEIQEKWGIWPWIHPDYGYVWRDEENEAIRPLDPTSVKTHFNGPFEANPNFGKL
jgi:hypothetical protein